MSQLGLGFADLAAPAAPTLRPSIAHDDPMPDGPYSVGLTAWIAGDGREHLSRPYTICDGLGRAIAGHVESRACAEAIVAKLNGAA